MYQTIFMRHRVRGMRVRNSFILAPYALSGVSYQKNRQEHAENTKMTKTFEIEKPLSDNAVYVLFLIL
jgi:hypothetical protein